MNSYLGEISVVIIFLLFHVAKEEGGDGDGDDYRDSK